MLFLDELPEFSAQTLEVLRQPLEDRQVTLARASGTLTFPANFTLLAAMNPCPCGFAGDPARECRYGTAAITRYQKRISGPLLDRINNHLKVSRIDYAQPADCRAGESSAAVRERGAAAHLAEALQYRPRQVVA